MFSPAFGHADRRQSLRRSVVKDAMLQGRRRIYRDSIHGDITFGCKKEDPFQKLIAGLLDTAMFQRLRRIRQTGVAHFVFHGAEHSRFAHSMGVAFTASRMFDAIARNSALDTDDEDRQATILAALLHDVGHGPFSHTLEVILRHREVEFDHEVMTARILEDEESTIARVLREYDADLPARLVPYIEKTRRMESRWYYQLVSSQIDADRLDYLLRDAHMAGVVSHLFDLDRLIGSLGVEGGQLVVDDRGRDVVESYLMALDQMYQAVYFHKTVRAASFLLEATLARAVDYAFDLGGDGHRQVFPWSKDSAHPAWRLFAEGQKVPLSVYEMLDEASIWALVSLWTQSEDSTLAHLATSLRCRRLPRPISLVGANMTKAMAAVDSARGVFSERYPNREHKYFVTWDDADRASYKNYWDAEGGLDAIRILRRDGTVELLEANDRSVVQVIKKKMNFGRLLVPAEIRAEVEAAVKGAA